MHASSTVAQLDSLPCGPEATTLIKIQKSTPNTTRIFLKLIIVEHKGRNTEQKVSQKHEERDQSWKDKTMTLLALMIMTLIHSH